MNIVEALIGYANVSGNELCRRAATEIEGMRAENNRLRTALEAEIVHLQRYTDRTHTVGDECKHPACVATRRIRAVLDRKDGPHP